MVRLSLLFPIYISSSLTNAQGKEYSQADINAAATKALELASQGQTLGTITIFPLLTLKRKHTLPQSSGTLLTRPRRS